MKQRRKKCAWCKELKPRSSFGKDVRLGCPPGAYCTECVGLMDAVKKFRAVTDRSLEKD